MNDKLRGARAALKAAFDLIASEPVPESIHETLKHLEKKK